MVNLSKTRLGSGQQTSEMSAINQADVATIPSAQSVSYVTTDEASIGQRIDNFLIKILKGVPSSHIYRILRSGEVRVNKKRVDATYRLAEGDQLRLPPIRMQAKPIPSNVPAKARLEQMVLFEDDAMLALNKPAGMAVHGGSGVSRGVIEQLRLERPQAKYLELVHRLDRETSGVLMVAKKRSALVALHEAMRGHHMNKRYLMLVQGQWTDKKRTVEMQLLKHPSTETGERRVTVLEGEHEAGMHSATIFYLRQHYQAQNLAQQTGQHKQAPLQQKPAFSLLEAQLITGRTHQLRVQLAHLGFPIAGDDRYGDFALNKQLQKMGLKRMFLHAFVTEIRHPLTGEPLRLEAPLPDDLSHFLHMLG